MNEWSEKSTVEIFLSAIEKGTQDHPTIVKLREIFPDSWDKALSQVIEWDKMRGK